MQVLFQGVTVLTAISALAFTSRSLDYTADATHATRDQLRIAERGQITERFGRAIDQLGQEGADKLSIRLGGIYALERVMHESRTDTPTVIAVLCAFVRTHAPRPSESPQPPPDPATAASSPDVQAAIAVLGRRPDPESDLNRRLDLSGSYVSMPRGSLAGVNLVGADLSKANLYGANLSMANLYEADLTGAILEHANLANAILRRTKLSGTNLSHANLDGADLRGADASQTGLATEQLSTVRLDGTTKLPPGVTYPTPSPSPTS